MLYLATFSFERADDYDSSAGSMNALIEADDPKVAVEKLETLIENTAKSDDFIFEGVHHIFRENLIEVKGDISEGIVTNIVLDAIDLDEEFDYIDEDEIEPVAADGKSIEESEVVVDEDIDEDDFEDFSTVVSLLPNVPEETATAYSLEDEDGSIEPFITLLDDDLFYNEDEDLESEDK